VSDERETQVQVAIRLPGSVLTRLDGLAEKQSQPGMRVTRTEVLRRAIHLGLDRLEADRKRR
jgi:predicted DNA-binding protein